VLCETDWQQIMGGQGRCKHVMETGGRMMWGEDKKWSLKPKEYKFDFWLLKLLQIV
jgi:hypothetical protein